MYNTRRVNHRYRRLQRMIAWAVLAACVRLTALEPAVLENPMLRVEIRPDTGTFDVLDRRCGYQWRQEEPKFQKPTVVWTIRERVNPVDIDGKLGDWPEEAGIQIAHTMTADAKNVADAADCSARVRFLWDRDALYMAAQVRDDKVVPDTDQEGDWEADAIELWIDGTHFCFRQRKGENYVVCWTDSTQSKRCTSVLAPAKDGWVLEARIEIRGLSAAQGIADARPFSLAVGVDDADGPEGRQGQIFAPEDYIHSRIQTFARAIPVDANGTAKGSPPEPFRLGFSGHTVEHGEGEGACLVRGAWRSGGGKEFPLSVRFQLVGNTADLAVALEAPSDLAMEDIVFPLPFAADPTDGCVLIPKDEGYMLPVSGDATNRTLAWSLSMPWIGATHLRQGHGYILIFETPDDVKVQGRPTHGVLGVTSRWVPTMEKFGPPRRMLYSFAAEGRYVSLAKRYRRYAREHGILRTFAEKAEENPNIERLRGAVDIYGHHGDRFLAQLQRLDIDRAIIHGGKGEILDRTNAAGYVSSIYDIYTDLYHPDTDRGKWDRCRYYAFPADCIKKSDGSLRWGWCHERDKNGKVTNPSYLACTSRRIWNMKKKIPADLAENHYLARFLDCETAAGLHECYDPAHWMSRADDRRLRAQAFEYVWSLGLMVGSERGKWWAMPWACYFEGIQSTGNFKDTDIGGWPIDRPAQTTPAYLRTELGYAYRLPLFELVFHDCVLTTWWWGDNNHRIPEVWARKDLIQVLYGTVPLWYLSAKNMPFFYRNADRFRTCYAHVSRWHRAIGFAELLDHQHLSDDMALQRSRFASGLQVTANFGDTPKSLPDGRVLPGCHYVLEGAAPAGVDLPLGQIVDPGVNWKPLPPEAYDNSDFENGVWDWSPVGGIELAEETEQPHQGRISARFSGTSPSGYSYARGVPTPVREGARMCLSGWMKVDAVSPLSAQPNFKLCLTASGKYVTNMFTSKYDTSRLDTWQKLEATFTVPEGKGITEGYIAVEKGSKESTVANLVVDEVRCTKID